MLNRNNLAKQFELIVQQEIKNHNDSLLATNLAINDLRDQIKELESRLYINGSSASNALIYHDIVLEKLKKELASTCQSCDSKLNDFCSKINKSRQESTQLYEDFVQLRQSQEKYEETINESISSIFYLFEIQEKANQEIRQEISDMKINSIKNLSRLKQEILDLPSEAQQVKKELEEKMSISAIDCAGLIKEVNICKKSSFIIDKKIENIYTLIERLDKRISS